MLHLEVQDNGAGLAAGNGSPEEGVGLSNTRARLEELYGEQYRFEFKNAPEGGLIVHISIPCRTEREPELAESGGKMVTGDV